MKHKIKELRLPNIHTKICNESLLKVVKSFPDLRSLDLSSSRISDDGLKILFNGLSFLRELILDKCTEVRPFKRFLLHLNLTKHFLDNR